MLPDPLYIVPTALSAPYVGQDALTLSSSLPMYVLVNPEGKSSRRERIGWRSETGPDPSVSPTNLPAYIVTSQQSVGRGDSARNRSLVRFEFPRKTSEGLSATQFNAVYMVGDLYEGDQVDGLIRALESLAYFITGNMNVYDSKETSEGETSFVFPSMSGVSASTGQGVFFNDFIWGNAVTGNDPEDAMGKIPAVRLLLAREH